MKEGLNESEAQKVSDMKKSLPLLDHTGNRSPTSARFNSQTPSSSHQMALAHKRARSLPRRSANPHALPPTAKSSRI
jgi:uncharacterized lipoprotein NlpE involved in copper resistance